MSDYRDMLSLENLVAAFPRQYAAPNDAQMLAFEAIAEHGMLTLEAPTGTGKTAVGNTYLEAHARRGAEQTVYITPNKTQVNQIRDLHPEMTVAYGRGEYDCLYEGLYELEDGEVAEDYDDLYRADEVPCLTLTDCPHRVNIDTGQTKEPGVTPCPYYQAKFEAKRAKKLVCTMSFFLFNNLFRPDYDPPGALVIDEAHQIADVFRNALSYDITDFQLRRSVKLLRELGAEEEAKGVEKFMKRMIGILRRKPQDVPTLLEDREILRLMEVLTDIDANAVRERLSEGIRNGAINLKDAAEAEAVTKLERLTQSLGRYLRSLKYAIPDGDNRHALNMVTYAYSDNEVVDENKVNYKLIIKSYYVAGLVRKLLSPNTLAMSATIGDNVVFGYETGIQLPFAALPGTFAPENALIALPVDTPDLSAKNKSRNQPTRVLRHIARACGDFGETGIRTLVVVVSNNERNKFVWLCGADEENVDVITYGDGVTARQALERFKNGEGTTLVGTVSNYGAGVDLPEEMAPLAFMLRPGYANPYDPFTQFEKRRFGNGGYWKVANWRVMIEALQVRGRNIRSATDRGATVFISQQFRKFLRASLPLWLQDSYRGDLTFEETLEAVKELLAVERVS